MHDPKQLLRDNHQHSLEALRGCERILFNACQRIKQHWTRHALNISAQNT